MPFRILNIAFPLAPASTDSVGGAEQVLAELDRALVVEGHTSLVVAAEGSEMAGMLWPVPVPRREVLGEEDRRFVRAQTQSSNDRALALGPVDLVHMHGIDFFEYDVPGKIPVLVTLHLPITWYPSNAWSTARPNIHFCCVSHAQRGTAPQNLRGCPVVENGVVPPPLVSETRREDFALVMGRICPEKNQHAALDAGTRAGI